MIHIGTLYLTAWVLYTAPAAGGFHGLPGDAIPVILDFLAWACSAFLY